MTSRLRRLRPRTVAVSLAALAVAGTALSGFGASSATAQTTGGRAAFSAHETIKRTYVENGSSVVIDKRQFSVSVDQTQSLRNRQEITVSWKGAHPTGGIVGDQTSSLASQEEYPVVLMMCRGVASTSAPAAKQVSQQTCWTQTPQERAQSNQTFNFPPYRIDQYATTTDRGASVGLPAKLTDPCIQDGATSGVQHWVPFVAASGKVYGTGPLGCQGIPPEASVNDPSQPSNTTYGVTDLNGSGSANFVITTNETNASLGCSSTVPCSLVVIPVMGISCDPVGFGLPSEDQPPTAAIEQEASADCETTGNYKAGQVSSGLPGAEALAVSGQLWWSASNWQNRIVVPLTFAAPDDVCSLIDNKAPQDIYGTPLLIQASLQWAPYFCTDSKLFNFQHIVTSEPEAKNLLSSGSISAAFQAVPPQTAFTKATVQAPTALTGFAVVYAIDTSKGTEYLHLKLDARLLAKLLTESYPAASTVQQDYPALSHNPLDLADDPEFQALNPGLPKILQNSEPAATILTLSSDSDVTWALTQYINDNPEARAWLNGKADPWGMKVNPAYKGIKLPVESFPLLDTFIPKAYYENNPCVQSAPVPYLPLVASPVENQATISLDMQYDIADSQVNCIGAGTPGQTLGALGREAAGQRFLIGVTSLGDAKRYALTSAELETQGGSTSSKQFTTDAGRMFAGPTSAGLRAGAQALQWNPAVKSWDLPYTALQHNAAGKLAYPGTMLVSTDIPTTGLPKSAASDYSKFLTFVAGRGQQPGVGNGDLPAGFLPLTEANGLGDEAKYTAAAATAVAEQKGKIPTSTGVLPGSSPSPTVSATPTDTGSTSSSPAADSDAVPPVSSPPSGGASASASTSPTTAPSPSVSSSSPAAPTVVLAKTAALSASGVGAKALPIALVVALLGALGIGARWAIDRRLNPGGR